MDFLRNCETNILTTDYFTTIEYSVNSLCDIGTISEALPAGCSSSNRADEILSLLSESKILSTIDKEQKRLWIFAGGKNTLRQDEADSIIQSKGLFMETIHLGGATASDLCEMSGSGACNSSLSTPSSASTPTLIGRHPHLKPAISAESHDKFSKVADTLEPSRIYRMFIAAVLSSISYALASSQAATPLGYRDFLSIPYKVIDSERNGFSRQSQHYYLSSIYVQLTARGHLILYISSRSKGWMSLAEQPKKRLSQEYQVRIAPSGKAARIVQIEEAYSGKPISPRIYRKSARWKRRVLSWLHNYGLRLDESSSPFHWLWVELLRSPDHLNVQSHSAKPCQFLWPAQLCFSLERGAADQRAMSINNDSNRLEFSQSKQAQDTFGNKKSDPLQVAQDFLLNRISLEPWHFNEAHPNRPTEPSSPVQTRSAYSVDAQLADTVYPTPPDCIAGPMVSSAEITSVTTATGDNLLQPEILSPNLDDNTREKIERSPDIKSVVSSDQDAFMTMEASESELLGEIDRDDMEATGITDADFNFFDEPEADMEGFLDDNVPSRAAVENQDADPKQETHSEAAFDLVGHDFKQDVDTKASVYDETSNGFNGNESTALVDLGAAAFSQDERINSSDGVNLKHQSSPNYTDNSIEDNFKPAKTLLESEKFSPVKVSNSTQIRSFDPMRFGGKMAISDAKYGAEGRYSFHGVTSMQSGHESDNYAAKPTKNEDKFASSIYLPANLSASTTAMRPPTVMLPATKLSQTSENETSQSDLSEQAEDELSELSAGQSSNSSIVDEGESLHLEALNSERLASSERLGSECLATISETVLPEKHSLPNTTEVILEALQPMVDGEIHLTTAKINSKPIPENVFLCQNPAKDNAQGNNIILSFENRDQTRIAPNKHAQDYVQSVQILVDQMAKGTLCSLQNESQLLPGSEIANRIISDTVEGNLLLRIKHGALPFAQESDIVQFASLDDATNEVMQFQKLQTKSFARRSSAEGYNHNLTGNHIHPMQVPLLKLQRNDALLELSPSSLPFWEALGLAPANGPKNVRAYCICPDIKDFRKITDQFLTSITVAYESYRLGTHSRGRDFGRYTDGIIPICLTDTNDVMQEPDDLQQLFVVLGKDLAKSFRFNHGTSDNVDNVVLYFINPFDDEILVWKICSWFLQLRQAFQRSLSGNNEALSAIGVILQLIPLSYMAPFNEQYALYPDYQLRLAGEVYDRCRHVEPVESTTGLDILCAPLFQLAEPLPKSIPFRLSLDPPSDLLNENAYMHVAYAKSADSRWVTAAWTDNSGKRQAHATYSLEGDRSFSDIAKELWQTTLEIVQRRKVTWKVIIVAIRDMKQEEMDAWITLVTIPTQPIIFTLLLTVDPDCPIRLSEKDMFGDGIQTKIMEEATQYTSNDLNSKGTGPHTSTAAQNAEATVSLTLEDVDSSLVDVQDEVWAITIAHRHNVSEDLTSYRPSLASGLLVKRIGEESSHFPVYEATRGPSCLALDLLRICNSSGNTNTNGSNGAGTSSALHVLGPRGYDHMLREILFMYGALGLLAKYRGMRDTRGGLLPWHVLIVVRGVKALECCMP